MNGDNSGMRRSLKLKIVIDSRIHEPIPSQGVETKGVTKARHFNHDASFNEGGFLYAQGFPANSVIVVMTVDFRPKVLETMATDS